MMKAMYEKVLPTPDASWRYWIYELDFIEFNWHYHPEYEIAVTLDGRGQRYIGDSIEDYQGPEVVLTGPNLPHTWHSTPCPDGRIQTVYIAQLPANWLDWLIKTMPEMHTLLPLLELSKRGILFDRDVAEFAASRFIHMQTQDSLSRFIALLEVLNRMQEDKTARPLSSTGYTLPTMEDSANEKIDRVIQYIHAHYTENLKATQLARHANMSTSHFHRFIKKRTEQTFTELVNQLRIGKACSLLIKSDLPVSTISDLCGFNTISNFNRRFHQLKSMTPRMFRHAYAEQKPWTDSLAKKQRTTETTVAANAEPSPIAATGWQCRST